MRSILHICVSKYFIASSNMEEYHMEHFELPARPEGTTQEQITQLWEYLFRLAERLNSTAEAARRD